MIYCIICNTPYSPTNKKHKHCGNNCTVSLYTARQKVRLAIKAALKELKTPGEVYAFNQSLIPLIEGSTNEQ